MYKKLRKLFCILLIVILYLTQVNQIFAIYEPLSVSNNKFGIHIIDENDLQGAASLVNTSGGDWGYITIVIREDDRNVRKWTETFKKITNYHLIPIIRLATIINSDSWDKPKLEEARSWSSFLDQLPWPIKNRYVVLFNEPNHAKEWGNSINPNEYADIVEAYAKELKAINGDFYILPAGLDASAPDGPDTMDERKFLENIFNYKENFFDFLDGWTSHSYPNPGFRGLIEDGGRGSLRTFEWELALLKKMGAEKNFPVFITETGWAHNSADSNNNFFSVDRVADLIESAAKEIWTDSRIVALTPFILNYQSKPFLDFSWQKQDSKLFYDQYDTYRSINKTKGMPIMSDKVSLLKSDKGNKAIDLAVKNPQLSSSNVYLLINTKNFIRSLWIFLSRLV